MVSWNRTDQVAPKLTSTEVGDAPVGREESSDGEELSGSEEGDDNSENSRCTVLNYEDDRDGRYRDPVDVIELNREDIAGKLGMNIEF